MRQVPPIFVWWTTIRHHHGPKAAAAHVQQPESTIPPPPPRLLRWRLKMQQYKFSARYNPGKENPLETYSPHTQRLQESTEQYVNFIAINAVKAITMEQLEEEARHDVIIQNAIEAKRQGNWHVIIESTTDDPRISTAQLKALHPCEQE